MAGIEVQEVLRAAPRLQNFCSVQQLHDLARALAEDSRFEVTVPGESRGGLPIHHMRFGTGAIKAMWVGGVHAMEPIGSLTVFSLLTLLQQGNHALLAADVASARRVVSFGPEVRSPGPSALPVLRWDDVPALSEDFERGRAAILARLPALLEEVCR